MRRLPIAQVLTLTMILACVVGILEIARHTFL
jgi:hypothetical protein